MVQKRGITLIELIICIGLLTLIIGIAFTMTNFGRISMNKSVDEYDLQASMRIAAEKTNRFVRNSTAIFTIPQSRFSETNLTKGWDYLAIKNVAAGSEIVLYKYNSSTEEHDIQILVAPQKDITYKLYFKKNNPIEKDKLLNLTIQGIFSSGTKKISVDTELEALNALQVVDNGTSLDPAVALAYRGDDRPASVVGHIAMVLDSSGSMAWSLSGDPNPYYSSRRIDILKSDAKDLIDEFATEKNIDISLVPFSTSANNPKPFRNAYIETGSLKSDINSLDAYGGTNTGDGLRRAYWGLKNHTAPSGVTASNYVIVLVDGVTTFASVESRSNRNFITGDGNVNEGFLDTYPDAYNGQIEGNGNHLDAYGTAYVNTIGSMLKAGNFAKVYVIGFSSRIEDLDSVNDIATACGAPSTRVFEANSSDALSNIFTTIRQEIVNDLWYLQGPSL